MNAILYYTTTYCGTVACRRITSVPPGVRSVSGMRISGSKAWGIEGRQHKDYTIPKELVREEKP